MLGHSKLPEVSEELATFNYGLNFTNMCIYTLTSCPFPPHYCPGYHLWAVIKPHKKQHEERRANLIILLLHKMEGRAENQGSRQKPKSRNWPETMEECGLLACSACFLIWPITQEWCSTQDHSYSGGTSHSGLGHSTLIINEDNYTKICAHDNQVKTIP